VSTFPLVPLRTVTLDAQTGPFGSQLHSDDYIDDGIPVINPSSIIDSKIVPDRAVSITEQTRERLACHRLEKDDLVFARRGELGRAAVTHDQAVGWLCGTGSLRVRTRQNSLESRFAGYVLQSARTRAYFEMYAVGSTMANLNTSIVLGLQIPLPPLEEQHRIANFLDAETARIDRLINAMTESLNLLQAKRRALLLSTLPSSGCPKVRLGYYLELVTSGPRGWGEYVGQRGTPFFRSANLRRDGIEPNLAVLGLADAPPSAAAEAARSRVCIGDVLIGITGANTGWVSLADQRVAGANVSQHVCLVRPSRMIEGRWLAYALSAPQIQELLLGSQYGGTKSQLSLGDIRDLVITIPSLDDQQRIIKDINNGIASIMGEHALRERQIALLAERRQALITAAVTGGITV
jgi:type I restriction enzyme, S subunit